MSEIKSYRDLVVWQKSKDLCIRVYRYTQDFPKNEVFGLQSQMRRSSVSVPSNIAEGFSRNFTKDYPRFLRIALGSLFELQTQIEIAYELTFFIKTIYNELNDLSNEIEKMLNALIRKIVQSKN